MATEGVDYAYARPSPQCLYSSGKRFVVRYLSYDTNSKNLTRTEAEAISTGGLSLVCNWEAEANGALGGYAEGLRAGQTAKRLASDCGQPDARPIYFSVDFDASTGDLQKSMEYFGGVIDAIGFSRCGVYGGYNTIDYFVKQRSAQWFWQTYAWSAGRLHKSANLYQYHNGQTVCGGSVDLDRAITSDYGQWKVGGDPEEAPPPDNSPAPTVDAWDYSGIISGTASEFLSIGNQLNSLTTGVNDIRNN